MKKACLGVVLVATLLSNCVSGASSQLTIDPKIKNLLERSDTLSKKFQNASEKEKKVLENAVLELMKELQSAACQASEKGLYDTLNVLINTVKAQHNGHAEVVQMLSGGKDTALHSAIRGALAVSPQDLCALEKTKYCSILTLLVEAGADLEKSRNPDKQTVVQHLRGLCAGRWSYSQLQVYCQLIQTIFNAGVEVINPVTAGLEPERAVELDALGRQTIVNCSSLAEAQAEFAILRLQSDACQASEKGLYDTLKELINTVEAQHSGHAKVVQMLNGRRDTTLHSAIRGALAVSPPDIYYLQRTHYCSVIKLLVKAGADPKSQNSKGQTVLQHLGILCTGRWEYSQLRVYCQLIQTLFDAGVAINNPVEVSLATFYLPEAIDGKLTPSGAEVRLDELARQIVIKSSSLAQAQAEIAILAMKPRISREEYRRSSLIESLEHQKMVEAMRKQYLQKYQKMVEAKREHYSQRTYEEKKSPPLTTLSIGGYSDEANGVYAVEVEDIPVGDYDAHLGILAAERVEKMRARDLKKSNAT